MLVCANFAEETVSCPLLRQWGSAGVLIHNYAGKLGEELKPFEVVILVARR